MSRKDKQLKKLLSGQSDNSFTFMEVTAILSREGYSRVGGEGSHQVWAKEEEAVTLVRHGNKLKGGYVKAVRESILRSGKE